MKWTIKTLNLYLQNLKQTKKLPHNLLLKTDDIEVGENLFQTLASKPKNEDCFIFRHHDDFEQQKQQLSDLFLWTNLSKKTNDYLFFYIPELEKYSYLFYNRLLKLLEDHKTALVGILQTAKIHSLPQTLISRCQLFVISEQLPLIDHSNDKTINRFFELLNQNASWKMLFSLYDETKIDAFWSWFKTLLLSFQKRLQTQYLHDRFLMQLFHHGWKLMENNLWAEHKYNFSLDGKVNWILFVFKVQKRQ